MPELVGTNQVIVGGMTLRWSELAEAAHARYGGLREQLRRHRVAFVVADDRTAFEALALLLADGLDGAIVDLDRLTESVRQLLVAQGFIVVPYGERPDFPAVDGDAQPDRIALLTSGSTGTPKLVEHTWATLYTASGVQHLLPRRWMLPYQTGTYAWYQVVTLGLFKADQHLVRASATDIEAFFAAAAAHGADAMSCTPTLWRLALMRVPEARLRLVPFTQLTLGGEIVDQTTLDTLRGLYPEAQLSHIYASTEAGACLVVHDARAGFPLAWLDRDDRAIALKIENNRLFVRSPFSSQASRGAPEQWIDTGDLVDIRDDRVRFVGRSNTALINVGGNKAYPADVEAALLEHPRVRWCRVRAVRAPLVGHLPAAEVVLDTSIGAPVSEEELVRFCQTRLPEYAVPRFWTFHSELPIASSLKSELS